VLDVDAVIKQLKLTQLVLVAHDASGPPAIDWALAHPEQVAGLVLLNTYYCQRDPETRSEFLRLLYQQFDATPGSRPAFFRLNADLLPTIRSRTKMIPRLREFRRPVRIIFGGADPYLNHGVARSFHGLFPASDLFLLPGARHFVQMDEPENVARLILSMSIAGSGSV
jgi:pimeloyl-ACP methyl ester carboxylesterase